MFAKERKEDFSSALLSPFKFKSIKRNLLQLGCEEVKTASLFSLIPAYCTRILQDLVNLGAWNFPNVARDLMMEQSACDKNTLYCINPLTAVNRLCAFCI